MIRRVVLLVSLVVSGCTKGLSGEEAAPPGAATKPARPDTTGWVMFEENERYGYKDRAGAVVLAPRYQMAQEFTSGGIACVVLEDAWRCIDGTGAEVLRPYVYDNGPDYFVDGLARFVEADRLGFNNEAGEKVIPARFEFVTPFAEGRAAFCVGCTRQCSPDGEHCGMSGGKWGLVDTSGKEVVAPRFDEIQPFAGGEAQVREGGLEKRIDRDGAVVGTANAPAQ